MKIGIVAAVVFSVAAGWAFGERFEADCSSDAGWDILDFTGDGKVTPTDGVNCPPGYGPRALRMEGGDLLAMPKGRRVDDGTIVVLYREDEPRDFDSDGVVLLRAQFGEDIAVFHNTKEKRPYTWVEQDNDTGFQLRQWNANGVESTLAERAGYGLITDPWNVTGWIWQKVQVSGGHVKAKFWPAQEPEPNAWSVEGETELRGGRVGAIIHSGVVDIAYFAVDSSVDIEISAPRAYLVYPQGRAMIGENLLLWLFTNCEEASEASCQLRVTLDGRAIGEAALSLPVTAGHGRTDVWLSTQKPRDGVWAPLASPLGAGMCTATISGGLAATCAFPIAPVALLEEQIGETSRHLGALEKAPKAEGRLNALCDAARGHLDAANGHYRSGRPEKAETSLRYANETLAELGGYKGTGLPGVDDIVPGPDAPYPTRPEAKDIITVYSPAYALGFGKAHLDAQSMVMGRTYHVTIPWNLKGTSPDRDYDFRVTLTSPLGQRVVASSDTGPDIPTRAWKSGATYEQHVALQVSAENPDPAVRPAEAAVLDEYHHLVVQVTDPKSGGKLILDHAPGMQPDRVGETYLLGQVYVSSAPMEIRGFEAAAGPVLAPRTEHAVLRNVGTEPMRATALLSVQADTKRVLHEAATDVEIPAGGECPVSFDWKSDTAGEMTVRLQVIADGDTLTEARQTVSIAPPAGYDLRVEKENRVGEDLMAHVTVHAGKGPATVSLFADGTLAGSAQSDEASVTVAARPWFGYYDVEADFGVFHYDKRIVATVVETRGTDLFVNGEPFLIKGTNVHGLDPTSPARTAAMMRIMRDLGFNTWRGDFPARWQVDLAYELNTVYTVLAPFSCTSTRKIFERQDGPPMTTAREQTRVFIERYKDSAGVLLWNSCNEIDGDSVDFLVSQYPLYKRLDAYQRPVHYANLYGQDYSQGQDIMGVNCYFSGTQTAASRHPIVERSLDIARGAGLPLIFCEFNAFNGAVHSQGADAMRNLYAWGVDQGMAGGFQYMKGDSTSHPGIFDSGFNTHALYDNAIVKAFADAEVSLAGVTGDAARIRIHNRRRFTLREMVLHPMVSGQACADVPIPDLGPGGDVDVAVALRRIHSGPVLTIDGRLTFVTHYGFRAAVPVRLMAR